MTISKSARHAVLGNMYCVCTSERLAAIAFFVTAFGFATAVAVPTGPQDRQITDPLTVQSEANPSTAVPSLEDLYFTKAIGDTAWSPDGREVSFTSNIAGRFNLWKVDAAGGWPVQLLQSEERQFSGTWSPDGKWIAFKQDVGGNELWDLFEVPSGGGQPINLTNSPDTRKETPLWSPDGTRIAMNFKRKDGASNDIALFNLKTSKITNLTNENSPAHNWLLVAWSRDAKTVYANRFSFPSVDSDVFAIDVASGQLTNLTAHRGKQQIYASSVSPDGATLLVTSNAKGGFSNVALFNRLSKSLRWATDTQWEAASGAFAPDGKSFTYTINADGFTDIYLADSASLRSEKLSREPGINSFPSYWTSFSPSGDRLLIAHERSSAPADIWVLELGTHRLRQLSRSAIASLQSAALPLTTLVHYKTFDGKTISALLWIPFNLKRDGSNPAVVVAHGGPSTQAIDAWNPDVAALVSHGYICIEPNVRGSTGYGMAFMQANIKDLGGGDLQDEVYAAKFLQATGYVDPKRIGIMGASYGGYMTLMAVSRTPTIWAAGVDLYGIFDWNSMVAHEDPAGAQYDRSLLGDPVADKKIYTAASPITYIHNVTAPLLMLHGVNDPNVPKEEAEQAVAMLNADRKIVDYHFYPDEGHGFEKREDQIDSIRRAINWFDRYLKGAP